MIALLVLGTIVDLLLAALLIGISGFVFGGGPQGGHGELSGVAVWLFGMLCCLGGPVAGFVLRAYGRTGAGAAVVWLPPLGALLVTFGAFDP